MKTQPSEGQKVTENQKGSLEDLHQRVMQLEAAQLAYEEQLLRTLKLISSIAETSASMAQGFEATMGPLRAFVEAVNHAQEDDGK